ncbi:MAG: L-seryl-tRNA(Sec) selenium transferase [Peptococcaceae bacterium]|nr:L-seryl-tRNA(Sec) selenium transferase [Peptococcaceae bacterium]MDH7525202.1 L-seryl-tRNA(Sec) selenium transferase [Peptococcaceae bacterium]
MDRDEKRLLRQLPAVHAVVDSEDGKALVEEYGHELVVEAANLVLDVWRNKLRQTAGVQPLPDLHKIQSDIREYLSVLNRPRLRRVVNATGIILHTNLGRAVLSQRAQEALSEAAARYTNLEYNLENGKRGSRYDHVEELLVRLTGAESAMVVNNNAGAVLLAVNTLAAGKEVIVSRGELVEIGGSFRIPEVLKLGGVTLREVGTTNRTHFSDYQKALNPQTGLILKVHTSNFRITGFTRSVERRELLELAVGNGIPLVEDLGSGSLLDLSPYGLKDETPVPRVIAEGVDLVTFSGDKLLGGPQAGIAAGKRKYIDQMKANQLARALRVDKFTLAALEATLREYLQPAKVWRNIPIYRMLAASQDELMRKAEEIIEETIKGRDLTAGAFALQGIPTKSQMGGGSLPGQDIVSFGLALSSAEKSPAEIERFFRSYTVPIIGYLEQDRFILDMRTLLPGDEEIIKQAIKELVKTTKSEGGST